MNETELAEALNMSEYPFWIAESLTEAAKQFELVIVYGYSDDSIQFDGAIYDEVPAYEGGKAYLTSKGLLYNKCDNEACPNFESKQKSAKIIEAIWCAEGEPTWTFKTDIPHETFLIIEDGEEFCRGIVFSMKALCDTSS